MVNSCYSWENGVQMLRYMHEATEEVHNNFVIKKIEVQSGGRGNILKIRYETNQELDELFSSVFIRFLLYATIKNVIIKISK